MKKINSFLVGGAVRDLLMGFSPKDRDFVVIGETVQSMEALGFKQVGKDFPVFLHPETGEEYALARRERKTGDGYNGFSVDTENVTLEDDLMRRDLTINSIAMNLETGEVIDPFGGWDDIGNKILRHTSEAFSEDPLRVIRLARFAARYDFSIAPETMILAKELVQSGQLNHISTERFWVEIEKAFQDDVPEIFFSILYVMGVPVHVDFFKKLIQNINDTERAAACMKYHEESDRLDYFCAILAHDWNMSMFPTVRAKRLGEAAWFLRTGVSRHDAESVFNLLLKLDAFREGSLADDFGLIFHDLFNKPFTVMVYKSILCRVKAVKASWFLDKEGKELGAAIRAKRIEIIENFLEC